MIRTMKNLEQRWVAGFADKKSCATARGRDLVEAIKGSADQ